MHKCLAKRLGGRVYKAEDVIQDVPASTFILELEGLGIAHRLLLPINLGFCQNNPWHPQYFEILLYTHLQSTSDHDDDTVFGRRLSVLGGDLVDDLLEGKVLYSLASLLNCATTATYDKLLDDAIRALHRLLLESEHRLRTLCQVSYGVWPFE